MTNKEIAAQLRDQATKLNQLADSIEKEGAGVEKEGMNPQTPQTSGNQLPAPKNTIIPAKASRRERHGDHRLPG